MTIHAPGRVAAQSNDDFDMIQLMETEAFRRFLLRIARHSGILIPASGADTALQYFEGRRSLWLEIIDWTMAAMPRGTTREQVAALIFSQSAPMETNSGRRNRHDELE